MNDRIRFFLNRLGERLWVKPLLYSLASIAAASLAQIADHIDIGWDLPNVSVVTIETLLKIISSSMLVIATFAVGSMVASYASASNSATPRSFPLVIADDVSQNALSSFLGAFIFSIVALVSLQSGLYGNAGKFVLLCLTIFVFAAVILTFLRWVDSIARLGRLSTTMEKVEEAASRALQQLRRAPTRGGVSASSDAPQGQPLFANTVGYVQRVDVDTLQVCAVAQGLRIQVAAMPGAFTAPDRPLAYITPDTRDKNYTDEIDEGVFIPAFVIGKNRTFDDDPRMGLIALSEIASRALSPAVNDPGTAIAVIDSLVRLFSEWSAPLKEGELLDCSFDRVEVPEISVNDMFDDAFGPIARDGAGALDVAVRLQKALQSLALSDTEAIRDTAKKHSLSALARAELTMKFPDDVSAVRAASFAGQAQ